MPLQEIELIAKVYLHLPTAVNKERTVLTFDGEFSASAEWLLETDGTSPLKVPNERDVHLHRRKVTTYARYLKWKCFEDTVLGIEATCSVLECDMNHVVLFDSSCMNYRHLALLCGVITSTCCFIVIVDILLEAANHGKTEFLPGAFENIMLWLLPHIETVHSSLPETLSSTNLA
ncbi:unnamed protein product [Soboliphyme baturini]|uniref:Ig-like domain-containing protein n=1 Tax=Soboliphyme baturini TaxID=241478 RepID=A0A183J491_9BILA|nr:unnamed protein product [Soboliphyme baturini]